MVEFRNGGITGFRINIRLSPTIIRGTFDRILKFLRRSAGIVSYESVPNHLGHY
jgi:hypothetical protein